MLLPDKPAVSAALRDCQTCKIIAGEGIRHALFAP